MNQIKGDMIDDSWSSLVTLLTNNNGQVLARKERRLSSSLLPYQSVLNNYLTVLRRQDKHPRRIQNTTADSGRPEAEKEEMPFVRRLQISPEFNFGSYPKTTMKRLSQMLNLTSLNPQTYKGELKFLIVS